MLKKFLILLFSVSLSRYSEAQRQMPQPVEISIPVAEVYLKYDSSSGQKPDLFLSYDVQYPYLYTERIAVSDSVYHAGKPLLVRVKALRFFLNTQSVMVSPGDTVEFRTDDMGKVQLSGRNEKYQNFMHYAMTEFYKKHISPFQKAQDSAVGLADYKSYCLSYFDKKQQYITNYYADYKGSALKEHLLSETKFELISDLCEYPRRDGNDPTMLAESYLSEEYIDLFNQIPDYFDYSYRIALLDYNSYLTKNLTGSLVQKTQQLISTAKMEFAPQVYYYLLMLRMKTISKIGNASYVNLAADVYHELKTVLLDTSLLAKVDGCYEDFLVLAKNIKDFDNVRLKDVKDNVVNLKAVLQLGKPCFIDFWATWCAACIKEFPHLDSIKKTHPEINFLSLSVDEDEGKWQSYMSKPRSKTGDSFLLMDAMHSKLVRDYNIKEYPRFILFDKDGNCLSGDFARPSDDNFVSQLNELLNKR